ncbi:hypothetical protein ACWD01_20910 [Streptomyces sp. NPDC002835]
MLPNKVNQDTSPEGIAADHGPDVHITPGVAAPGVFTPAAARVGMSASTAVATYVTTRAVK